MADNNQGGDTVSAPGYRYWHHFGYRALCSRDGRCYLDGRFIPAYADISLLTSPDNGSTFLYSFYILAREGISMERAYGTAALLIILILLVNVVANILVNKFVARGR